jgi:hypothetical protein
MENRLYLEIEKKQAEKDFFMEVRMDICWWASLGLREIQELALILSRNALPVWDSYDFPQELKNRLNSIKHLPVNALHAISNVMSKKSGMLAENLLTEFFTSFVTPVIQFQDGELKLPYEVKSAFLSVFDILKGMLSVRNKYVALQCFSSSITRSMDAIKISNLLTQKEISMLTQKYLLLSNKP